MSAYTPTPGSIADRVIRHVTEHGEASTAELNSVLGLKPKNLPQNLKAALRRGVLSHRIGADGLSHYSLGDCLRVADPVEKADLFHAALWTDGDLTLHNLEGQAGPVLINRSRVEQLRALLCGGRA